MRWTTFLAVLIIAGLAATGCGGQATPTPGESNPVPAFCTEHGARRHLRLAALLAAAMAVLAGCVPQQGSTPEPTPAPTATTGRLVCPGTESTAALCEYQRCLQLDSGGLGGPVHLFWPPDWSPRAGDGEVAVLNGAGQVVGRVGEGVSLRVREVPSTWDDTVYRQLVNEVLCSCMGGLSWVVEGLP